MRITVIALMAVGCLVLAGCAQGPGHTRAAGTVGGTAIGAAIGAAASASGHEGEGALVGGILGAIVGSEAGNAIAYDQEVYDSPPHRGSCRNCDCDRCAPRQPCRPRPCRRRPRRVVVYEEVYDDCGPGYYRDPYYP